MIEFEMRLRGFFEKAVREYEQFTGPGGVLEGRSMYVFQTVPREEPELMIVGLNPGGDYCGEAKLVNCVEGENMYVSGEHQWFQTLRRIFGYPENERLARVLEGCVGTNKCFVNTGNADKLPKEVNPVATRLVRELVDEVVRPRAIVALSGETFCTLKNGPERVIRCGEVAMKVSSRNGVPVAFVYNPSPRNGRYFSGRKCEDWGRCLEEFLGV